MIPLRAKFIFTAAALFVLGGALLSSRASAISFTGTAPTITAITDTSASAVWNTSSVTSPLRNPARFGSAAARTFKAPGSFPQPANAAHVIEVRDVDTVDQLTTVIAANCRPGSCDAALWTAQLYMTRDGGTTWTRFDFAAGTRLTSAKLVGNTIYASQLGGNVFVVPLTAAGTFPALASVTTCGSGAINDLAVGGSYVYAAGDGGRLYHWLTTGCGTIATTDADPTLTADFVAVSASGNTAAVVATNGLFSVSQNANIASPTFYTNTYTSSVFQDVAVVDANNAYAVGLAGLIAKWRWAGVSAWSSATPAPTSLDLHSIAYAGGDQLFAFGYSGPTNSDFYLTPVDGSITSASGGKWWSAPTLITGAGVVTTQKTIARMGTALNGWIVGDTAAAGALKVVQYTVQYASSAPNVPACGVTCPTNHTANFAGLKEAVNYHASIEALSSDLLSGIETSDMPFKTSDLRITGLGVSVTKTKTTARLQWPTSMTADSRAFISPTLAWQSGGGLPGTTTVVGISGQGDTSVLVGNGTVKLMRSTDMGGTYTDFPTVPAGSPRAVATVGNRGWAVGTGFIDRLDGTNRTPQAVPAYDYLAVYVGDDQHAWVVGSNAGNGVVLRTVDGGATWTQVLQKTGTVLRGISGYGLGKLVVAGDGLSVFVSNDSGDTWAAATVNGSTSPLFRAVKMVSASTGWAVGDGGGMVRTTDGGKTWDQLACGITNAIYGVDANITDAWFVGEFGLLKHWTSVGGGCPGDTALTSNTLTSVNIDAASNVWVGGENGYTARYGLDTANAQYHTKTDAGPVHDISFGSGGPGDPALTSGTPYYYFVESVDAAGYNVISSRTTFTTDADPEMVLSKTSSAFVTAQGTNPVPPTDTFNVTEKVGRDLGTWTATSNSPAWLTVSTGGPPAASVTGGSTPMTVTITINSAALVPPGPLPYTYNGMITVVAADATVINRTQTYNVSLRLEAPPVLTLIPAVPTLNFNAVQGVAGSMSPVSANVGIKNDGGGTLQYTVCQVGTSTWLAGHFTVSAYSAAGGVTNQLTVTPDHMAGGGLVVGNYTDTIKVDPTLAVNCSGASAKTITVNLAVTTPPIFTIDSCDPPNPANAMNFTTIEGTSAPASQCVTITNTGGGVLSWTSTVDPPAASTWLNYNPPNGTVNVTPDSDTLVVSPPLMPRGNYSADIVITSNGGPDFRITVSYSVTSAPDLEVSVTAVALNTVEGINPADGAFDVRKCGAAGWVSAVTTANGLPWLRVNPSSGGACPQAGVAVQAVNASFPSMTAGTYIGTIVISPPPATPVTNPPQWTITVTLTVTAPPILRVTPNSISYSMVEGTTLRPADEKTFTVSNIGSGNLQWSIDQPASSWAWITLAGDCSTRTASRLTGNTVGGASQVVRACVDMTGLFFTSPPPTPTSIQVVRGTPGAQLSGSDRVSMSLTVLRDATAPVIDPSSLIVTRTPLCLAVPPNIEVAIEWTTDEPSDSYLAWGENVVSSIPQYERPVVLNDVVDTLNHTGGTTSHRIVLDAAMNGIVSGHRYYFKISSRDRFNNPSPRTFTDHDRTGTSWLSFVAPTDCDNQAPTNVTLTVCSPNISGFCRFTPEATDASGIARFDLYRQKVGDPAPTLTANIAPVASDPAQCSSSGTDITCHVDYSFDSRSVSDGQYDFFVRALDPVTPPNQADSPLVRVTIENAEPTVTNVKATPAQDPVTRIWYAIITWDTDKQSDSRVDYGKEDPPGFWGGSYNSAVSVDMSGAINVTSHSVKLDNLEGGKVYHFQVTSCKFDPATGMNTTQCGH